MVTSAYVLIVLGMLLFVSSIYELLVKKFEMPLKQQYAGLTSYLMMQFLGFLLSIIIIYLIDRTINEEHSKYRIAMGIYIALNLIYLILEGIRYFFDRRHKLKQGGK